MNCFEAAICNPEMLTDMVSFHVMWPILTKTNTCYLCISSVVIFFFRLFS